MKKVLSLLLAICMTMTVCVPSAYAAEGPNISLKTVPYIGVEQIENAIPSKVDEENGIDPLLVVAEGADAYLTRITVHPGYIDGGQIMYATDLSITTTFPEQYIGGTLRPSSAETRSVLDRFLNGTGRPAELWYMEVHFDVFNDRWGSYGKYFEFTPTGNLIFPAKQSNGTVRYDLPRTNVDTGYNLFSVFMIPENTTSYYFGLGGGFWYYNIVTNKTLSQGVSAYADFNYTT